MNGRRAAISGLLLAVTLTAVAYRHLPAGYFLHDDWDWLELAARAQTRPGLLLEPHMEPFNYRVFRPIPLGLVSAVYTGAGLESAPYTAVSLGLHLATVCLVWLLAGRLGLSPLGRAVATGLFGLNWGHREALFGIAIVQVLLCTFFSVAAAIFWISYVDGGGRRWLLATAGSALLALLSKEQMVMLPAMLAALAYARTGRARHSWAAALLWLPMAPILAVIMHGRADDPLLASYVYAPGAQMPENLLSALTGLVLPPLAHTASAPGLREHLPHALSVETWIWTARGTVLAAALAAAWRGTPLVRAALAWAVFASLPITPFIYPPASRYLYLPFVGAALLGGLAIDSVRASAWPRWVGATALAAILAWGTGNLMALRISVDRIVERGARIQSVLHAVRDLVPDPPPGTTVYLLHTPSPEFNLSKERVGRAFRLVYGEGMRVEERPPDSWAALPPPAPGRVYVVLNEVSADGRTAGARLINRPSQPPWREKYRARLRRAAAAARAASAPVLRPHPCTASASAQNQEAHPAPASRQHRSTSS